MAGNTVKLRVMDAFRHNRGTTRMVSDEAVDAAVDALVASRLGDHKGINGEEFVEAARAALEAAAPHMLATISTRVELESLWLGSVVLSEGVAYQRFGTDDWAGEGRSFDGGQIVLPATVLHNPNPYRTTK